MNTINCISGLRNQPFPGSIIKVMGDNMSDMEYETAKEKASRLAKEAERIRAVVKAAPAVDSELCGLEIQHGKPDLPAHDFSAIELLRASVRALKDATK